MSSRIWLLALLLATSAFADDFTAADGLTWAVEIPPGWHVIDSPAGRAEGVHIRLASSPSATWENTVPPAGHAVIIIGLYGGDAAMSKPFVVQKIPEHATMQANALTSTTTNLVIDGRSVPLTVITNDANAMDVSEATAIITTSLHLVTP